MSSIPLAFGLVGCVATFAFSVRHQPALRSPWCGRILRLSEGVAICVPVCAKCGWKMSNPFPQKTLWESRRSPEATRPEPPPPGRPYQLRHARINLIPPGSSRESSPAPRN